MPLWTHEHKSTEQPQQKSRATRPLVVTEATHEPFWILVVPCSDPLFRCNISSTDRAWTACRASVEHLSGPRRVRAKTPCVRCLTLREFATAERTCRLWALLGVQVDWGPRGEEKGVRMNLIWPKLASSGSDLPEPSVPPSPFDAAGPSGSRNCCSATPRNTVPVAPIRVLFISLVVQQQQGTNNKQEAARSDRDGGARSKRAVDAKRQPGVQFHCPRAAKPRQP